MTCISLLTRWRVGISAVAAVHFVSDFAAALCNLQRRFVAAMMFRSPSGLIWRFFLAGFALAGGADPDSPRTFAHLAFCAKAIRRLAAALIFLRLPGVASGVAAVPLELPVSIARSSAIWASMRSFWAVNPSIAAWMSSSFSFIGKSVFPTLC